MRLARLRRVAAVVPLVASAALAAQVPGAQPPTSQSFIIRPGVQFGVLRESTSRAALSSLVPPNAIRDEDLLIGEGFCAPGTLLYPGTPDEIAVTWQDAGRTRVAHIRTTSGQSNRWMTAQGVRVGTLLTDLERLSGRTLEFSGFGWDYGGGLMWSETTGDIRLRLKVDPADVPASVNDPDSGSIKGDHLVRSDRPLVRRLRIRVYELMQVWASHYGEYDCAATGGPKR